MNELSDGGSDALDRKDVLSLDDVTVYEDPLERINVTADMCRVIGRYNKTTPVIYLKPSGACNHHRQMRAKEQVPVGDYLTICAANGMLVGAIPQEEDSSQNGQDKNSEFQNFPSSLMSKYFTTPEYAKLGNPRR